MVHGVDPYVTELREGAHESYRKAIAECKTKEQKTYLLRELCKTDRFFLLVYILKREDCDTDWVFARCREVEADPDSRLDIWAREHYKCVHEDTEILMASGLRKPIKDVSEGDLISGYGEGWKSEPVPVIAKSPRISRDSFKITLRSGQEIIAGKEHPFLTVDGWEKAHNLVEGDYIGIPRQTRPIGVKEIDESELKFIAYMTAEGCFTNQSFTNADEELVDDFKEACSNLGFGVTQTDEIGYRITRNGSWYEKRSRNTPRNLLREYGIDTLAIDKKLPKQVAFLSGAQKELFVGIILACDGWVSTDHAGFTLGSKALAQDMQYLLLDLGVRSTLHSYVNGHAGAHVLSVYGYSSVNRLSRLPIPLSRKKRALEAVEFTPGKDDPIPAGWEGMLTAPPRARKFRNVGVAHSYGSSFTSREKVRRFAEIDRNQQLSALCDSDVAWVPIVKIEDVGEQPSYDIQVGGQQAMISAGIISHNTTIITNAGVIQEHLKNPDITIAIFSFNRPIAKGFFRQIRWEYEHNEELRALFPEIFWENTNQAPKWSEDDGLVLRRGRNTKEASLEAWGLIDGQPTSKHFDLIIYNDIVTGDTVNTPDMVTKTTVAWENSLNLSTEGGRIWYEGTFWNYADTYNTIMERGSAKPRIYPGTTDGTSLGEPVLFSDQYMAFKKMSMSAYVFACQILCNPKMADKAGFQLEWLRYWKPDTRKNLNNIIVVDPATTKRAKDGDWTVMWVIGLGPDQNYYVVDVVRDRLGLFETAKVLFTLHAKYRPSMTFYEEYGMQRDIEYLQEKQAAWNYRFHVGPLKGLKGKNDRIARLQPLFRESRIFLPETKVYTNSDGEDVDLVKAFIYEELILWPYSKHDDMLDSLSRILDAEGVFFPVGQFDDSGQDPDDVRYDVWSA